MVGKAQTKTLKNRRPKPRPIPRPLPRPLPETVLQRPRFPVRGSRLSLQHILNRMLLFVMILLWMIMAVLNIVRPIRTENSSIDIAADKYGNHEENPETIPHIADDVPPFEFGSRTHFYGDSSINMAAENCSIDMAADNYRNHQENPEIADQVPPFEFLSRTHFYGDSSINMAAENSSIDMAADSYRNHQENPETEVPPLKFVSRTHLYGDMAGESTHLDDRDYNVSFHKSEPETFPDITDQDLEEPRSAVPAHDHGGSTVHNNYRNAFNIVLEEERVTDSPMVYAPDQFRTRLQSYM